MSGDDTKISRHAVTKLHLNNVAQNQLFCFHTEFLATTAHNSKLQNKGNSMSKRLPAAPSSYFVSNWILMPCQPHRELRTSTSNDNIRLSSTRTKLVCLRLLHNDSPKAIWAKAPARFSCVEFSLSTRPFASVLTRATSGRVDHSPCQKWSSDGQGWREWGCTRKVCTKKIMHTNIMCSETDCTTLNPVSAPLSTL